LERLEKSGARQGSERERQIARQQLAKHIIDLARAGERDPWRLSEDALLLMAKANRDKPPRRFCRADAIRHQMR
jgi:hypothetical protein